MAANNHPPASLLAWGVGLVGEPSELSLRLPFALLGAGGVMALGWALAPAGRRVALPGAALLALAPAQVLASQQVRGYAPMLLAGTLALGCAARLLAGDRRRSLVVGLALATGLAIWSHATFVAAAAALALIVLRPGLSGAGPLRWGLGLGCLLGLLLWAPILGRLLKFVRRSVFVEPGIQGLHPGSLGLTQGLELLGGGDLLVGALFAFLAGLGTIDLLRARDPARRALGSILLVPLAGFALLLLQRPLGYPRFALFALPAALGLAGAGLGALGGRVRVSLGLALCLFASGERLLEQARGELQDYRGASRQAVFRGEQLEGARIVALGAGAEVAPAYLPGVAVDLEGARTIAALARGDALVLLIPFPRALDPALRERLCGGPGLAPPWVFPGREADLLVIASPLAPRGR